MTLNYGTWTGSSQQHTGSQLRVAGYGPGAANIVGLTDNTDLFFTIRDALGLVDDTEHGSDHGKVRATPSSVKAGKQVRLAVSGFGGDRQVSIKVTGPQGQSGVRDLCGGAATLTIMPKKKGIYMVTVTGLTSGKAATDTFRVK